VSSAGFCIFVTKFFVWHCVKGVIPTGKKSCKPLRVSIKSHLIKMVDAAYNHSAMDSDVNTQIEKSSELLTSETLDSPADNVPPAPYRLFNRQKTIHEVFGGGIGMVSIYNWVFTLVLALIEQCKIIVRLLNWVYVFEFPWIVKPRDYHSFSVNVGLALCSSNTWAGRTNGLLLF